MDSKRDNAIQSAIQDEAQLWGEESFYAPSPGQTWSHVANRITRVVAEVLDGRQTPVAGSLTGELLAERARDKAAEDGELPYPELDAMDLLNQAVRAEDDIMLVYPCVIIPTRYGGVYESGQWAAFGGREVPDGATDSDIECAAWWAEPTCLVAVGRDPNEAFSNLIEVFKACEHPDTEELPIADRFGGPILLCTWCHERIGGPDMSTPGWTLA